MRHAAAHCCAKQKAVPTPTEMDDGEKTTLLSLSA